MAISPLLQAKIDEAYPRPKRGWDLPPRPGVVVGPVEPPKKTASTGNGNTLTTKREPWHKPKQDEQEEKPALPDTPSPETSNETSVELASPEDKKIFPALSLNSIKEAGAEFSKKKLADLEGPRRNQELARPRQALMYFAYVGGSVCGKEYSMPTIGAVFGNRDHTTVMHAMRKIEELRYNGPLTDNDIAAIELLDKLCKHFGVTLPEPKPPK